MNDVRQLIYGTIVLFLVVVVVWLSSLFVFSCGLNFSCHQAAPIVDRTSIPTLSAAKFPAATQFVMPTAPATPLATETSNATSLVQPSNPGGPGPAVGLT